MIGISVFAGIVAAPGCRSPGDAGGVGGQGESSVGAGTSQAGDSDGDRLNKSGGVGEVVAESNRQLEQDRQAVQFLAWQHVKALTGMWTELPPEYFPGLTSLAKQVDELKAAIEVDDKLMVGLIDPDDLTTHNPDFWRAMLETNPEDPVVPLFEQMLWAARGYFDRANWLIELHRYGPALPPSVHRVVYTLADEMRRLRARESNRKNQLLENVPPEQVPAVIATARTFQPGHPDWLLSSIVMRLQMGGVDMSNLEANSGLVDGLMVQMREEWQGVARNHPLIGARLNPDRQIRAAAEVLANQLDDLGESRGAFGGRDLNRLSDALAGTKLYGESLLASRRAVGMRGFSLPTDMDVWWRRLPELIGPDATASLRLALESGEVRPVSFFEVAAEPEGVSLLPLHPIMAERSLRRLQEVERKLEQTGISDEERAASLLTKAETMGHLGRWDAAETAMDAVAQSLQSHTLVMRAWVALWSGRTEKLDALVAGLDPEMKLASPAVPALAQAAQGRWLEGAESFKVAANSEEVQTEFRTYYTLMAAAFTRLAGNDEAADELIEQARLLGEGHDWVSALVRGMAGETGDSSTGAQTTEITEAGRVCEQRFYKAFQRDISPSRQQALLEACVATGVVDFVEYTASLLRLRQLDPQRWDPTVAPPPAEPEEASDEPKDDDLTRGANPSWSLPS